jgi:hypothetical protein
MHLTNKGFFLLMQDYAVTANSPVGEFTAIQDYGGYYLVFFCLLTNSTDEWTTVYF